MGVKNVRRSTPQFTSTFPLGVSSGLTITLYSYMPFATSPFVTLSPLALVTFIDRLSSSEYTVKPPMPFRLATPVLSSNFSYDMISDCAVTAFTVAIATNNKKNLRFLIFFISKNIVNRAITIFCKHRIKNRCWIKYEGDPKVYWVALLLYRT